MRPGPVLTGPEVPAMIHPSDPEFRVMAVRDGRGGPVTCANCGCRLASVNDDTYAHFNPLGGRDARGCRVACADAIHDRDGRPVSIAV
jgi:hypothetical protein